MNTSETQPAEPKPERPRFQFSLRTLLLLFVVLGSLLILAIVGWLVLHLLVVVRFEGRPRTHAELKEQAEIAMKEMGGTDFLEKEAKAILSSFRARPRSIEGWGNRGFVDVPNDERNYPAIVKLYFLLPGGASWVVADEKGLPAHVVIRFGSHAHYAYIWMFDPADMPLGKIEDLEHLSGTVYLAEKNE